MSCPAERRSGFVLAVMAWDDDDRCVPTGAYYGEGGRFVNPEDALVYPDRESAEAVRRRLNTPGSVTLGYDFDVEEVRT